MAIRVARAGEQIGNWEVDELQALVDRGEVLRTDLVWTKGFLEWRPLADVWAEVGVSPPIPASEAVPPIPGSFPPPLKQSPPPRSTPEPFEASKADLSAVTFRKRATKRYGFSTGTKVSFALVLLAGGWLTVNYGLPWLNQRWAANFDSGTSTASRAADSEAGTARSDQSSKRASPYSRTQRQASYIDDSAIANRGMSQGELAECRKNAPKFVVTRRIFANTAQFTGPDIAVNNMIANLRKQGISDECIAYLNANM